MWQNNEGGPVMGGMVMVMSVACGKCLVAAVAKKATQGKTGVAITACAVENCSRKNPAWLTYAASSNAAVCLKTDTELL